MDSGAAGSHGEANGLAIGLRGKALDRGKPQGGRASAAERAPVTAPGEV